jgi:hypothetical protein
MKIWNKRWEESEDIPDDAVYVGRPSPFGNPYSHLEGTQAQFKVRDRATAISMFERWVHQNPELIARIKSELKGKDLICWCAPKACHAEVLFKIANEE